MSDRSPSEIARDTFKLLAARRLTPTPDNYRALYEELAGIKHQAAPFPDTSLRQIARLLPAQTPPQKRLLEQFEAALDERSWPLLQRTLIGYANLGLGAPAGEPAAASEPADNRLQQSMLEQVARMVEYTVDAVAFDDTRLRDQALQLLHYLRQPAPDAGVLRPMLSNFALRLSFNAEEQGAIRASLLEALNLVLRNIGELSVDERWLKGQVEALTAAATPPLSLRRLDDLQARLKDVLFKQSEAKARSVEAQEQMKRMLAVFLERLSAMSEESGVYQEKIEHCAEQLGRAGSIDEIAPVLQEVIAATRAMALDSRRHRDDLVAIQEQAEQAQAAVGQLQQALDRASAEARHDTLTGALNRKGLDEAIVREIARARRLDTPLCLALLDIDNFKKLNDRLGHAAGDAALAHLAQVARESMRPQDQLARYGGEEFVVLLPDTLADDGVQAMQRMQRELTKRFFLQGGEKVLITFSAGIAQLAAAEEGCDALARADQAMYLAKRAGKNRVVLG
ncbi:MAG: GGDEF domain-containing protein [Xylophilus ampelinus]